MEFVNPLEFKGYEEKVKSLKEKTGLSEAVVTGKASIEGNPAVIAVCDGRCQNAGGNCISDADGENGSGIKTAQ